MKAADIMVSNVIVASPDHTVYEVMEALVIARISGVPVVAPEGELVGIVTEGVLMRRSEAGTRRRHSRWFRALWGPEEEAAEFIKENALKVEDVMTRQVVTATPDTELADIADLLESKRIKRVPIVQGDKLVGIVTRLNLVQAALAKICEIRGDRPLSDDELRQKVIDRLKSEPWAAPLLVDLKVHDGEVELWGMVDSPIEKKAVRVAVETTPGVRAIDDHLIVRPPAAMGV
jgi:CBS domain-containing protein